MGVLSDLIKDPAARRAIVDDGVKVIDAEVSDKRGISGMAVKAGYKAVKKIKPGFINVALDMLMPEFAQAVDPFYDEWKAKGSGTLEAFFKANDSRIANALLAITDRRVDDKTNRAAAKAYKSLRGQGVEHTKAAMPRLAGLVSRHVK
ncbi:MAG: hypothetical protein VX899_17920 [Myxococcota bacterium]|nr:hypothetical protein [Myxococcota bacterium]